MASCPSETLSQPLRPTLQKECDEVRTETKMVVRRAWATKKDGGVAAQCFDFLGAMWRR